MFLKTHITMLHLSWVKIFETNPIRLLVPSLFFNLQSLHVLNKENELRFYLRFYLRVLIYNLTSFDLFLLVHGGFSVM